MTNGANALFPRQWHCETGNQTWEFQVNILITFKDET